MALGLAACEKEGVIHCDLKPDNVLMHKGGALLTDFGLSLLGGKCYGNGPVDLF
jgi:serine/threonine protein kinase